MKSLSLRYLVKILHVISNNIIIIIIYMGQFPRKCHPFIVLLRCFMFESLYLPNAKRYRLPYFQQFILYHFSMTITFWSLALATRNINVRYPTGFKPAITLGRASNSVCRCRGPIPIDLYCSLIFMPSVTEIQYVYFFPPDSRQ